MKRGLAVGSFGVVILMVAIMACEPLRSYPETPEISFKFISFEKTWDPDLENYITKGVLRFHLVDGDGDVGVDTSFTLDPNFFSTIYKKTDTGFVAMPVVWSYRTPYFINLGQDKSLVADFEVTYNFNTGDLPVDTIIKFKYYIYDRQGHRSNDNETPEFPSDTLGIITAK